MSKTYAIADLHGRFDLLEMALAKIADHAELPATVVTLGDYVDRGPDSRQVIERLMGGLGHEGWRLIWGTGGREFKSRRSDQKTPIKWAVLHFWFWMLRSDFGTKRNRIPAIGTESPEKSPKWFVLCSVSLGCCFELF